MTRKGVGRLQASLAYRSSAFYQWLAERWSIPKIPSRPPLHLDVLTLGGAAHLGMIREMLFSLAKSWPTWPRVTVATDGSLDAAEAQAALSFWPPETRPRVVEWRELLEPLRDGRRETEDLLRFAERDAMGRKLAAAAALARAGDVLYTDVDVLWRGVPPSLDRWRGGSGPRLVLSTDIAASYDPALVPERLPELVAPPHFCAGFFYARGDFLAAAQVGDLLGFAAERGIGLTEQTILAEAARRLGGERFSLEEIALFEGDRYTLGPSVGKGTWAARHYVGQVRHLFYRDAISQRFRRAAASGQFSGPDLGRVRGS